MTNEFAKQAKGFRSQTRDFLWFLHEEAEQFIQMPKDIRDSQIKSIIDYIINSEFEAVTKSRKWKESA